MFFFFYVTEAVGLLRNTTMINKLTEKNLSTYMSSILTPWLEKMLTAPTVVGLLDLPAVSFGKITYELNWQSIGHGLESTADTSSFASCVFDFPCVSS